MKKKLTVALPIIAVGLVLIIIGVLALTNALHTGTGAVPQPSEAENPNETTDTELPSSDEAEPENGDKQDSDGSGDSSPVDTTDKPDPKPDTEQENASDIEDKKDNIDNDEAGASHLVPNSPVDLAAWQELNGDIYSWITVEDTDISFPIAQSPDDDAYYLKHDYNKEYNRNGAVFTESCSSKDFSDFMTVVYAHTMRSGAMFAGLLEFRDLDYFNSHRKITVYTPDKVLEYRIFAAYLWDDRHILKNFDFSGVIMRKAYLAYVFDYRGVDANIDKTVEADSDDRFLTLSCCTFTAGERYLVQAVLTAENGVPVE